jgi:pSer/pThr/pTyr-binding forkhead associated (FHA) protein
VLSVQELNRVARSMKVDDFERQLGPFVLIQRPPDEMTQQRALMLGAKRTIAVKPGQKLDRVELLLEFDELLVATLPFVEPGQALTVGRLPDCDLVIDDPSVSKHHATLTWDAGAVIEDAGSSNGTTVNGQPITSSRAVHDTDELAFGDARFCYLLTRSLHERLTTGLRSS